jgi:hypothetical protein
MGRTINPDLLDSTEVYDHDELLGYALVDRYSRKRVTPVMCCRTCAWALADRVTWIPGEGPTYVAE